MGRDDDIVAPRFKEGPRHGGRLLIHHTSRGPGFDTLRRLQAAAEPALAPATHVCPLFF